MRDNRTKNPITAQMPAPAQIRQLAPVDFIEGAAKSLRLLEAFSPERQRLNATQAAERAQLSRAAARRHLLTLEHLGYLEGDGEGSYWLTPRVLRLSGITLPAPACRAWCNPRSTAWLCKRGLPSVWPCLTVPTFRLRGKLQHCKRPWSSLRAQPCPRLTVQPPPPTACTWARGLRCTQRQPGACSWPNSANPL